MKVLKRIFLITLTFLAVVIILRGTFYRRIVAYKSIGQRINYEATSEQLTQYLNKNRKEKDSADIENIIKKSLFLTSKTLNFTFSKSDHNPNKLIDSQMANCIGYAAFFSAVCNYLLKKHNLSGEWIAQSEIRQLYVFGINIHPYFTSSFFKDHDFVIIKNRKTKETFTADPIVHDYLYINFVTLKK